ncbi:MAG: hypothetical protein ACKVQU_34565 [Burkholderiales bacterium]
MVFLVVSLASCSRTSADPTLNPTLTFAGDPESTAGSRLSASQTYPLAADADASEITVRVELSRVLLVAAAVQPVAGELADLARIEPRDLAPDALMVADYLREGAAHKAVAAARSLLERRPDDPALHQLMGAALLDLGDARLARASFEGTLRRDPSNVGAIASLAQLDLQDGKTDLALKRFEDAMAKGCASAALCEGHAALMRLSGLDRGDEIGALRKRTLASSVR